MNMEIKVINFFILLGWMLHFALETNINMIRQLEVHHISTKKRKRHPNFSLLMYWFAV